MKRRRSLVDSVNEIDNKNKGSSSIKKKKSMNGRVSLQSFIVNKTLDTSSSIGDSSKSLNFESLAAGHDELVTCSTAPDASAAVNDDTSRDEIILSLPNAEGESSSDDDLDARVSLCL